LAEAKTAYGANAILSNFLSNFVVTVQAAIRGCLEKGIVGPALQAQLGTMKPGVARTRAAVDPKQAFMALYQSATPEERKKLLAELQGK
jgi:hypothetical protein